MSEGHDIESMDSQDKSQDEESPKRQFLIQVVPSGETSGKSYAQIHKISFSDPVHGRAVVDFKEIAEAKKKGSRPSFDDSQKDKTIVDQGDTYYVLSPAEDFLEISFSPPATKCDATERPFPQLKRFKPTRPPISQKVIMGMLYGPPKTHEKLEAMFFEPYDKLELVEMMQVEFDAEAPSLVEIMRTAFQHLIEQLLKAPH